MADIHVFPEAPEGTPVSNFVHLHVHSDYSLLDGAVKLDTLVAHAKQLNMKALALTDHGNMFGSLNFEHICHANGINPIVGCEFYVAEDHTKKENTRYGSHNFHLILLCENETGYKNMSWLCSRAFTDEGALYYGKPRIDFELLKKYHEGIICLSACVAGELPRAVAAGNLEDAENIIKRYKELFGPNRYYIEIQNHGLEIENKVNPTLIELAHKLDVPLVVTNDIHYDLKEDAEAQDALRCIGFKKLLDEPHESMGEGRTEWYFKTEEEMRQLFPDLPEACDNTVKIAQMCNLTIHQYKTQELKGCLPRFELPKEFQTHGDDYTKNQDDYVRFIVEEGLKKRYKEITPEIRERLEYEIGIIFSMGFSGYFLIVWEFINWAKSTYDNVNDRPKPYIPIGPGRGSGAGSLVAYCMGITDIDPFRFGLIFERFLNPERVSMPDFDVDMDFDFRQDIIQHTRDLYGEPQVGHIVTFGTLKPKNCLADVARVLGIPLSIVDKVKKTIPENPKATFKDALSEPTKKFPDGGMMIPIAQDPVSTIGLDKPTFDRWLGLCKKLEGLNRNTGLHASGMVIGLTPLPDWAPVFKDAKTGEVGVQYTMDIIEPCGLVKFDYLGLKTLSLIRYAENIVNKHRKEGEEEFHVENVSETDSETFDMFSAGDSVAVFQFESPGMQKILRQAKPRCIEELVALNALYRPGPMDYIPQYIEGKWKPETIHYPDPCLEGILKETYGVMVYQEQVMQVAQKIAGFSLGGADMLRRAMGKKKEDVLMGKKVEFEEGAVNLGYTKEHADEIFDIMIPFAGYGFNKSHAAAYTVLAYRTAWLKCHKPAEFMAANLTNEIASTDGIPPYVEEARKMGLCVDPPDINLSDSVFDVVDGHIVFGFCGIKGMGQGAADSIVKERNENGPYKSFDDFISRALFITDKTGKRAINNKAIEVLIKTGAFDKLDKNRATLLMNYERAIQYEEKKHEGSASGQVSLFADAGIQEFVDFKYELVEDLPRMEKLNMELELVGCFLSGHPLDDWKIAIENSVTCTSENIERLANESKAELDALEASGAPFWKKRNAGKEHIILGIIQSIRPIMTKKGTEMAFAKLADYKGTIDLTFFSDVWEIVKNKISVDNAFAFKGKVDGSRESPSFIVKSIEDISTLQKKSISQVHIKIADNIPSEQNLSSLRDFLFGESGNCCVYLHIDLNNQTFVVKANSQLQVPSTEEFLTSLKDIPYVADAWTE